MGAKELEQRKSLLDKARELRERVKRIEEFDVSEGMSEALEKNISSILYKKGIYTTDDRSLAL